MLGDQHFKLFRVENLVIVGFVDIFVHQVHNQVFVLVLYTIKHFQ